MITRKPAQLIAVFSLLLMLTPGASAQTSAIVPGAITVVGEGMASAPAETANIAITIGADSNVYIEPMTIQPGHSIVPDTIDVTSIVDAIIAYGVPVNDVTVPEPVFGGEWGSGMTAQPMTILITIMNPSVEGLTELLDVVRTAAHAEGLFVNQFGVMYGVADCRSLRQQARVDAVAHARSEAEDQAAALNTSLGNVTASRDTFPMTMAYSATNACTSAGDLKYTAGQFDPSLPAEVTVSLAVEMSFEIP